MIAERINGRTRVKAPIKRYIVVAAASGVLDPGGVCEDGSYLGMPLLGL